MYDIPGMVKAGLEIGGKVLDWSLQKLALKNTPEMKVVDQARKDSEETDKNEKVIANEDVDATRDSLDR